MFNRHESQILTRDRITKPFPTWPANRRRSRTRRALGHGSDGRKKTARTRIHSAPLKREAPRSKSSDENLDKSVCEIIVKRLQDVSISSASTSLNLQGPSRDRRPNQELHTPALVLVPAP